MSVSAEVQRTLVKSPPELWTELSDAAALTRHLGELGEIRVTQVEPETKVEWEADGASGIVQLKQSGWGTKVTLSVTREGPAVEGATEMEAEQAAATIPEPPAMAAPEPEFVLPADPEPEPSAAEIEVEDPASESTVEPDAPLLPTDAPAEPEPRLGFFARLFRRKAKPEPAIESVLEAQPVAEPEPEPPAMAAPELEFVLPAEPEPIAPEPETDEEPDPATPVSEIAAELAALEAEMVQQTTALLTGVLDRLGAAHHRPFSRG